MKIKTVNITDQVVEYLKENIESGKWNIGEKIPSENQMVMELGVSRSSIRSALQYLIGIGVLKSYQGKGTFLINTQVENWDEAEYKITSEDCMDICKVLEFRKILEPGACVLAMENCDYLGSCSADCFLMGTNAITVKGELVNIDGAGNRVACLIHGPRQVIIVVGMNKIVRSIEDGIDRIQTQACPIIADATGRKTPCGVKGVCMDCQSPDCMCCSIVVTRRSRYDGRIKVVIVGENLGY